MKCEIITTALLFVLTTAVTGAQEPDSTGTLNLDNVPEKYVVKEGDTLWDISERFLGNPHNWPDVWKMNDYIANPHLIYPGQTILLKAMTKQALEIEPPRKVESTVERKPVEKPDPIFVAAAPRIADSLKTALSNPFDSASDGSNIIELLKEPQRVYTERSFMRTGFILQRSELPKPRIIDIEEEKNSATKFDKVVIDIGSREGVREGDIFAAIDVGEQVKHPDTGKNLGLVIRIKGVLKVVSTGEKQARCLVMENFDPMEKDDPVMLYRISKGPKFDAWVKPEVSITGTILAIHEPMLSIHINDILYLDRGSVDGVRPGDRFAIYSSDDLKNTSGFKKSLGIIEAISVMANETAGRVISLKGEHIEIGDQVVLTARCRIIN